MQTRLRYSEAQITVIEYLEFVQLFHLILFNTLFLIFGLFN